MPARSRDYPAEIVTVISNVPQAQGLLRAEAALIPTLTINHKDFRIAKPSTPRSTLRSKEAGVRATLQRRLLATAHAALSKAGATAI